MNSVFKLSLFATVLAFAVPSVAMATTAQHQDVHKYYKGHRYSKKAKKSSHRSQHVQQSQGDQETADLNARSLQVVQSVNNGHGNVNTAPQVVPNPEMQLPPSARVPMAGKQNTSNLNRDSLQDVNRYNNSTVPGNVVVAPGTGNVVAPPAAPGAVNPNNMPPAQY